LLKDKLLKKVEQSLSEDRFQCLLPKGKAFLTEIEAFFKDIAEMQTETIESCKKKAWIQQRIWNSCRFTETQLDEFLKSALTKYTKGKFTFPRTLASATPTLTLIIHTSMSSAMVEPGEAVGAIGAQSISEPGTQMTLKVSEMFSVQNILVQYQTTNK